MNLFLEWSIQNKWMKNCEESYCFKRCFCEMNLWKYSRLTKLTNNIVGSDDFTQVFQGKY